MVIADVQDSRMTESPSDADERLTPIEAGQILGIGPDGVKVHDRRLQPERTPKGRRLYLRSRVEEFARERAAKRGTGTTP